MCTIPCLSLERFIYIHVQIIASDLSCLSCDPEDTDEVGLTRGIRPIYHEDL